MLPFLILLFLKLIVAQPHCIEPTPRNIPRYSDCEAVIRLIEDEVAYTGDPLLTASRRPGTGLHLPKSFDDLIEGNRCAVDLDLFPGTTRNSDTLYLSDVAYAAQQILEECLARRILSPPTEGWYIVGRRRSIRVKLGRAHFGFFRAANATDIL